MSGLTGKGACHTLGWLVKGKSLDRWMMGRYSELVAFQFYLGNFCFLYLFVAQRNGCNQVERTIEKVIW
jgi:hypothetical protein